MWHPMICVGLVPIGEFRVHTHCLFTEFLFIDDFQAAVVWFRCYCESFSCYPQEVCGLEQEILRKQWAGTGAEVSEDAGVTPGVDWGTNRIWFCCSNVAQVPGRIKCQLKVLIWWCHLCPDLEGGHILSGVLFSSLSCKVGALYSENLPSILFCVR